MESDVFYCIILFMEKLTVRKSEKKDLSEIYRVVGAGRKFMRDHGNHVQWTESDAIEEKIPCDIEKGNSYVVTSENGMICGTFAFIIGEDPTYAVIEDGEWPDNEPYGTIHRIASDGRYHGILTAAVDFCRNLTDNLRIDTYLTNKTMQKCAVNAGFIYAGVIHVGDGTPRLAYTMKTKRCDPEAHTASK